MKRLILSMLCCFGIGKLYAQDAIINEWSQGNTGTTGEWVEILVNKTGGMSLAGWSLRLQEPKGMLFQFAPSFPKLPAGTLVLVYMNAEKCRCRFPTDYAPNMPTGATIKTCDILIDPNDPKFVSINDWANGKNSSNSNNTDNYFLFDASGTLVQDWDLNDDPAFIAKRPGSASAVYLTGAAGEYSNPAAWTRTRWDGDVTPGKPNGGANTAYIEGLLAKAQSTVRYDFIPTSLMVNEGSDLKLSFKICPPAGSDGNISFDTEGTKPPDPAAYGTDYVSIPARDVNNFISVPIKAGQDTFSFVIRGVKDCAAEKDKNISLISSSAEFILDSEDIKILLKDGGGSDKPLNFIVLTRRNPSCPTCTDGAIVTQGKGGKKPYSFSADGTNFNVNVLRGLKKGKYPVEIKDADGCTVIKEVELK